MAEPFVDYQQGLEAYLSDYLSTQAEPENPTDSAAAAIVAYVDIEPERPGMFSILVCHEGVTAIRYDLAKATGAALAAVGALSSSPTRLKAVSAVVACLLALRGIRGQVPVELSRVILAIHEHHGSVTRAELREALGDAVPERDIEGLLTRLEDMGAVRVEDGAIRLQEKVIVRYTAIPRITPVT